jgi:hypothetical protein
MWRRLVESAAAEAAKACRRACGLDAAFNASRIGEDESGLGGVGRVGGGIESRAGSQARLGRSAKEARKITVGGETPAVTADELPILTEERALAAVAGAHRGTACAAEALPAVSFIEVTLRQQAVKTTQSEGKTTRGGTARYKIK